MIMKPLTDRKWKGYTLEELQHQRTVNDARILVQKMALKHRIDALQATRQRDKNVVQKMLSALNYVDYAVLGLTLARKVASILSHLRKK